MGGWREVSWGRHYGNGYSVGKIFSIGAVDCLEGTNSPDQSLPGKVRVPGEACRHLQSSKEEPQASAGSRGPWLPPQH